MRSKTNRGEGRRKTSSQEVALLRARLEEARRDIEDLEALAEANELLDASLDAPRLVLLALRLTLRVLRADAALLVRRENGREIAHSLARRGEEPRAHELNPSGLAREVLETGREGSRRGKNSPGARAAAELLGEVPALRIAVPLRRVERVLGALEVAYRREPDRRLLEESNALRALADHVAIALENARLVRERDQRVREISHLYDIGMKINAHLDLAVLLEEIVDSFLELVPADAAGIFLIEEGTREIREQTLRGYREDRLDEVRLKIGRGILGWVASTGKGVIVPDVRLDERYVEARSATRSEMAAPLNHEGHVIGVFNLESDQVNAYGPRDLELLTAFGNQAAISIMNARLHAEVREKRHIEEQLEVARDIQIALLPRSLPAIPGHSLAGKNLPSSAVGGDYFDFLPLAGGRWAVIVADVSGNGIPAGLIMAGFRAEVRAGLRHRDDPREVLAEVNGVLCGELEPEHFVTAFLGVYAPDSGTLIYCNAGHEPGLLVRREGGVERLGEGGLLLGAFPEADYRRAMVHLARGDRLLLYTDGLSDGPDPQGGVLGPEGILRLLAETERAGLEAHALPEGILQRAAAQAARPPEEADDRTIVVLVRHDAEQGRGGREPGGSEGLDF